MYNLISVLVTEYIKLTDSKLIKFIESTLDVESREYIGFKCEGLDYYMYSSMYRDFMGVYGELERHNLLDDPTTEVKIR